MSIEASRSSVVIGYRIVAENNHIQERIRTAKYSMNESLIGDVRRNSLSSPNDVAAVRINRIQPPKYNPIKTREEAERIEQLVTEKLRKKGHGVWSN